MGNTVNDNVIEIDNVTLSQSGRVILKNINYKVKRGETSVIMGPSGAGKSSLLKTLVGLWRPDSGTVKIDGVDITHLSERELFPIRTKMAFVFQGNALFDSLTVEENVAYFLTEHRAMKSSEIKSRVAECLSFVNLEGTEKLYPEELSGGMKKRVAIARAIAFNPSIILYDEPTTGLDPINSETIIHLIRKIQQSGATSIIVTHIIKDAISAGDTFTVIEEGEIVESGTADKLFMSSGQKTSSFLREIREEAAFINRYIASQ